MVFCRPRAPPRPAVARQAGKRRARDLVLQGKDSWRFVARYSWQLPAKKSTTRGNTQEEYVAAHCCRQCISVPPVSREHDSASHGHRICVFFISIVISLDSKTV
jgi:hypothetical protein